MSARIPETMLLSDLLKPTGYDCPADLQGKTFEEATSGSSDLRVQTNKEASITENGTIVIEPDEGYDATKKVTATVNVPSSGGSATAYAWKAGDGSYSYLPVGTAPADETEAHSIKILTGSLTQGTLQLELLLRESDTYTRISDNEFTISWGEGGSAGSVTLTHDSSKDVTLWG